MCTNPAPAVQSPLQSLTEMGPAPESHSIISPPPPEAEKCFLSLQMIFSLQKSIQHTEPHSPVFCVCLLWISAKVLWFDSSILGELLVCSVLFLNDPTVRIHHNLLIHLLTDAGTVPSLGYFESHCEHSTGPCVDTGWICIT